MKTYQDWLQEFYPTTADSVAQDPTSTPLVLIRHSLQKWKGLTEDNLSAHSMSVLDDLYGPVVRENFSPVETIRINSSSCSLCAKYYSASCYNCPFVVVFDETCMGTIDHPDMRGEQDTLHHISPWGAWTYFQDPNLMIRALSILEAEYTKRESDAIQSVKEHEQLEDTILSNVENVNS